MQEIINSETTIAEEFVSKSALQQHYQKHCLADSPHKKSDKNNILYDFADVTGYKNLEQELHSKIQEGVRTHKNLSFVWSLFDALIITQSFYNLFKGNFTLYFSAACGFQNERGHIAVAFTSFANEYTKNYLKAIQFTA